MPTPSSSSGYSHDSQSPLRPSSSSSTTLSMTSSLSPVSSQYSDDDETNNMFIETNWYFWYCWSKLIAYKFLIEMQNPEEASELNLYTLAHEISLNWLKRNGM